MSYIKISELAVLTSGNLIASNLSIIPVVSDISAGNVTYKTSVANIKTYVETGNLSVTGNITSGGGLTVGANLTVAGNLTVSGNTVVIGSNNYATTDNIIELHLANLANINQPWLSDDGKDIGIRMHYYDGTNKEAALVFARDSNYLEWYVNGAEGNVTFGGNVYGGFKPGSIILANTTDSTSLSTGTIVSNGGAALAGNLRTGGNIVVGGYANISGITTTTANIFTNAVVQGDRLIANSAFYTNSYVYAGYVQTNNSGTFGTTLNVQGTATVNELTSNGAISGTTVSGTTGTFTTKVTTSNLATGPINANGAVTVSSLASNGTITATTLNAATIGNSGAAITGATGLFTTSTTTSALNTGTLDANSTATVASLTSNGNITGTNITTSANATSNIGSTTAYYSNIFAVTYNVGTGGIVNSGANATGNIGSSTNYFNTVFAQSTSALYADLAEVYQADNFYYPGTVVVFGGTAEVTVTDKEADTRVAGAVSTDPAYLMNAKSDGVAVALRGKIPVKVVGPVGKGDLLVTSNTAGHATSVKNLTTYDPNAVFAKSMEADDSVSERTIWAVIL